MKHLPFAITAIVVIVSVLAGDWMIRVYLLKKPHANYTALSPQNPSQAQPFPAPKPQVNEWQEYHTAREQALHDNPDLAAEYQVLRSEIEKQEQDVNAAMVKADPTVAPIIAKVALLRKRSLAPSTSTSTPNASSATR